MNELDDPRLWDAMMRDDLFLDTYNWILQGYKHNPNWHFSWAEYVRQVDKHPQLDGGSLFDRHDYKLLLIEIATELYKERDVNIHTLDRRVYFFDERERPFRGRHTKVLPKQVIKEAQELGWGWAENTERQEIEYIERDKEEFRKEFFELVEEEGVYD